MTDYIVTLNNEDGLVRLLRASFEAGPMLHENEKQQYEFRKALVENIDGLKIEIFANEHPPPHFRVKYQGMTANFRISDGGVENGDRALLRKYGKNIKSWWNKNKPHLIKIWNERRPADCPVGEYRGG